MKRIALITFSFFYCFIAFSADIGSRVHKFDWEGLEVVWIEDERFPTYDVAIYFADGALSDHASRRGETQAALSLITAGTNRYKQKDLIDHLEFFGVSHGPYVTHEYTLYNVSGLVKDVIPTFKRLCHMFKDASYPKTEVNRELKRARDSLSNMVADRSSLASRAFRELSMGGTPFAYPTDGKIKDLNRMTPAHLKEKLDYFNQKVSKRIYLTGPKSVLAIKDVVTNECGWNNKEATFKRDEKYTKVDQNVGPEIFLITVPDANQAQIRIGRYLDEESIKPVEGLELLSTYLGGGFTSLLMRELRTKRGFVYGASAFAAGQRRYGRSAIQTSTKNENVVELLDVVKDLIKEMEENKIRKDIFSISKGRLAGSYPFRFEKSSSFLQQLIYLDHVGIPYQRFLDFPEYLEKVDEAQIAKIAADVFDWNRLSIVIVGSKTLAKPLSKFGKISIINYKDFL